MSFGIYKQGQGYWVRVMSAAFVGLLILAGAGWGWGQAETVRLPIRSWTLATNGTQGVGAVGDTINLYKYAENISVDEDDVYEVFGSALIESFEVGKGANAKIVIHSFSSPEVAKRGGESLRVAIEKTGESPRARKRVFNVLVECIQNVYHHMDTGKSFKVVGPGELSTRSAVLIIGKIGSGYYITTGNYVLREKAARLKMRLKDLNELTEPDLKVMYQDVLTNTGFSDKGGAGLGFIDILRKTQHELEYNIESINEKFCYFSLRVKIPNPNH